MSIPVADATKVGGHAPVLLDDVEVAAVYPQGVEAKVLHAKGIFWCQLRHEDAAGKVLVQEMCDGLQAMCTAQLMDAQDSNVSLASHATTTTANSDRMGR
jgi:hypothetical protein